MMNFRVVAYLRDDTEFKEAELPEDVEIVGRATTTQTAIDLVLRFNANTLLFEPEFERTNCIEFCRILSSHFSHIIVLVDRYHGVKYCNQLYRSGATAICLKYPSHHVLVDVFGSMRFGQTYVEPELESLLKQVPAKNQIVPHDLTERELDVLARIDLPNAEIARELQLTEELVFDEIQSICRKLKVRTRTSAHLKAVQLGLV